MQKVEESEQVRSVAAAAGKHRISAALNRLHQDTQSLQKELELLENMEAASIVCKGILSDVESRPDPLLPVTKGPTNPSWDRWFEGPQDKPDCKCCIM
uniref:guanine nucleotide-binding protein subunit gamma 1-like isoform X1 n=1 Tax=Erigeron canadensis TaxID=72917 RepID=UPI001CB8B0F3|nr:guanine nucleotide-binding protein subunit gamma 1-like isoform X1 [Erigeron canadensis]